MAHAPLITRAELPRYGIADDFLSQFNVLPIRVRVAVGGVLGEMAVEWQNAGDEEWGGLRVSSSVSPWSWSPTASAVVTFPAGTYPGEAEYLVSESGGVTASSGAPTATAVRYDLVADAMAAATGEALMLMRPRKQPAILSWGAEIRRAVAMLVRYNLKDLVGFAPVEVNVADFQIKDAAVEARRLLERVGRGELDPWEMTDSSASGTGNVLTTSMLSDDPAWDC